MIENVNFQLYFKAIFRQNYFINPVLYESYIIFTRCLVHLKFFFSSTFGCMAKIFENIQMFDVLVISRQIIWEQ